jgi:hypothetical protein
MGAYAVICPRCEGSGKSKTQANVDVSHGKKKYVEIVCPLCSGTGRASMLEKMARNLNLTQDAP